MARALEEELLGVGEIRLLDPCLRGWDPQFGFTGVVAAGDLRGVLAAGGVDPPRHDRMDLEMRASHRDAQFVRAALPWVESWEVTKHAAREVVRVAEVDLRRLNELYPGGVQRQKAADKRLE